ncbi:MAG: response regulator transcription factor [Schleiferiaceae bacterium]|jgi:DNA-binding NarL/FixJ family response regulator|nr:response regulator transcription factor [Schleiferiaceae bacterium]
MTKRFLLLDDHSLFLEGLQLLLSKSFKDSSFSVYSSIKELQSSVNDFSQFDVLISDLELPGENVFDLLEKIKKETKLPVLIISMHKKYSLISKCEHLNIEGYILKNENYLLEEAVNQVIEGNKFYSEKVNELLNSASSNNVIISEREKEVMLQVVEGSTNQEIADKLFISIETVKTHKKNIKSKLGTHSNHDLIQYAKDNFLV